MLLDRRIDTGDSNTHLLSQVRLLLLAALSQEHILYIGPPGTAKSELGRRLSRLCAGTFFERLLTRFSVPEVPLPCWHHLSLVTPIDMSGLQNIAGGTGHQLTPHCRIALLVTLTLCFCLMNVHC